MANQEVPFPGEFELIAKYFAPLSKGFPGAYGLLDDAATVSTTPGHDLVVKTDAVIGGVHFHNNDPAELVARKALRVNLSDLACKGAVARAYMLDLILPSSTTVKWLSEFAKGLALDQHEFGVHLIGGDTNATPGPLTVAVMAFGEVPTGRMLRRKGAQSGDRIFVTGTIGDAALGLRILRGELQVSKSQVTNALITRYQLPLPRVKIGPQLLNIATATIDISDGLIADLQHICDVSALAAIIESDNVPLSADAKQSIAIDDALFYAALTGGDDYEILFTAPPGKVKDINRLSQSTGVPITDIGYMKEALHKNGNRVALLNSDGAPLQLGHKGWTHF